MVVVDQGKRAIGRTIEVDGDERAADDRGQDDLLPLAGGLAAGEAERPRAPARRDPRGGRDDRREARRESAGEHRAVRAPTGARDGSAATPEARPSPGCWRGATSPSPRSRLARQARGTGDRAPRGRPGRDWSRAPRCALGLRRRRGRGGSTACPGPGRLRREPRSALDILIVFAVCPSTSASSTRGRCRWCRSSAGRSGSAATSRSTAPTRSARAAASAAPHPGGPASSCSPRARAAPTRRAPLQARQLQPRARRPGAGGAASRSTRRCSTGADRRGRGGPGRGGEDDRGAGLRGTGRLDA